MFDKDTDETEFIRKMLKEKEEKPDVKRGIKILSFVGVASLVVVLVFGVLALVTLIWWWVVPDVFAGAVKQGLLPAKITMIQALKLWVLFWAIGVRSTTFSSKRS